jgi:hypothetical protein
MFYQIRFQTGETTDIISEMKKGNIPCMDVEDIDEFNWFINHLSENGVYKVDSIPYDKNSRDKIKEPEFEFRVAFSDTKDGKNEKLMYIDFYFPLVEDETYDSIFGD